jgi:hypothetical protein
MRILMTRDRDWICFDLATAIVRRLIKRYRAVVVIVHGDCRGVDNSFRSVCRWLRVKDEPRAPEWARFGDAAGPRQNAETVASKPDLCVALHRSIEASKGTKDCVKQALAAGIAVYLVEDSRGILRRLEARDERLKLPRRDQPLTSRIEASLPAVAGPNVGHGTHGAECG